MDFTQGIDGRRLSSIGTASSVGTTVDGLSSGAKGSYVQLSASTPFAATGLLVTLAGRLGSVDVFVDLAVGAAGSEQIFASDLWAAGFGRFRYFLPIRVPAGVRLAARASSTDTSFGSGVYVNVQLIAGGMMGMAPLSRCDALGIASNAGTTVTAGGSANTKGSWAQLIASTARMYRALIVATRGPAAVGSVAMFDVGIGAASSEQVVIPDIGTEQTTSGSNDTQFGPVTPPFPCVVPAASRIAGRVQAQTASQACKMAVYGLA